MIQNGENNVKLTPDVIATMVNEIKKHINGDESNIRVNFDRIEPQPANLEWLSSFENIIRQSNENPDDTIFSIVRMSYAQTWAVILIYIPNRPIYNASLFSNNECNYSVFTNNRELPEFLRFVL
jgi:hypothetical protein